MRRGWSLVSADYRVTPESTAPDTIEDLKSAYAWVADELNTNFPAVVDTSRIIVAGSSAGGYCTVVGGVQFKNPVPKALLAIYPIVDPGSQTWWTKGVPMADTPMGDAAPTLAKIDKNIAERNISFGEAFPPDDNLDEHERWPYIRFIIQEGLYLDYMTGTKGLGPKIAEEGKEKAIPKELRQVFPGDFGVTPNFPSLIITHGTADKMVPVGESEELVKKLQSIGAKVEYFPVEGEDHGFDMMIIDCEEEATSGNKIPLTLETCLKTLDEYVA